MYWLKVPNISMCVFSFLDMKCSSDAIYENTVGLKEETERDVYTVY